MVARVVIDTSRRAVMVDGSTVHLTRREFDLLAMLASRPGEVFTRTELLEAVWHSNADWQSEATVTEHVRRIRAKLDRDPEGPSVISTRRGVGYAFEPGPEVPPTGCLPDHGPGHSLVVLDGTRIVHASPAAADLVGAGSPDELVGRETLEFVAETSLPAAKRLANQRARGEVPRPEQIRVQRLDGSEITVDVATSVVDWNGRLCHQISIWPEPAGDPPPVDATPTDPLRRTEELLGLPQGSRVAHRRAISRHPLRDRRLAMEIGRAVEAGQFVPHYEPVVHLETERVVAVEALARWEHPARGTLRPASFIGLAERTGDIVRLGTCLLRTACAQLRAWERSGLKIDLAVNLSARQLLHPDLHADVAAALEDHELVGNRLVVELTETDIIEDVDGAADALDRLARQGVRIAIDDFGTGWASLTYLQRFPVDILKIDRSFTTGVLTNPNETAIARSIIALANDLDLLVIAEGIESADQKAAMFDLGCWLGQGHHFAFPQPGGAVDLVRATRSTS